MPKRSGHWLCFLLYYEQEFVRYLTQLVIVKLCGLFTVKSESSDTFRIVAVSVIYYILGIKGTKNLSKKRARAARNAKENQKHIMTFTLSSAEGIYIYEVKS